MERKMGIACPNKTLKMSDTPYWSVQDTRVQGYCRPRSALANLWHACPEWHAR